MEFKITVEEIKENNTAIKIGGFNAKLDFEIYSNPEMEFVTKQLLGKIKDELEIILTRNLDKNIINK